MSLRQVTLLPSGPTTSPLSVIKCCRGRFAVCSTLAVYVFNQESYAHESVITCGDRKLMSVSWSSDGQHLGIVSQESSLYYADVNTNISKQVYQSKFRIVNATCCPQKPNVIYVLSTANLIRLELQFEKAKGSDSSEYSYNVDKATVASFSSVPLSIDFKSVGSNLKATVSLDDGTIVHVDVLTKKVTSKFKCSTKDQSQAIHVSWDPLSAQYFALVHKDGNLSLWDAESTSPIFSFAKQPSGSVRSIVWIPSVPGGFVTYSNRGGVIRVWNVSNPTPLSSIKIDCMGIKDISMTTGSQKAICTYTDRVAVIDLESKKSLWETQPGHVDTIFTCTFHDKDPNKLLTGGFDQHIKEWDVLSNKCIRTFSDAGGLIYEMKVSKDGSQIAVATERGEVKIFDYKTGLVTQTITKPKDAGCAFFVSWLISSENQDDGYNNLLIGYGTGLVTIVSKSGTLLTALKLGGPKDRVNGAVDPFDPHRLAITCGCNIHIVKVKFSESSPQFIKVSSLPSLDKRSQHFSCCYSPHVPNLIAVTCDDKTVSILSVTEGKLSRLHSLCGHKKKTRAIVWHPEIPWLVLSSSWDGTVIAWDIRDGSLICKGIGHNADVYGLSIHPQRPFVMATTSRDSTIRFWEFGGKFRIPALQAIVDDAFIRQPGTCEDDSGHIDMSKIGTKLCGKESFALSEKIQSYKKLNTGQDSLILRAKAISGFFFLPYRHQDLWTLVEAMKGTGSTTVVKGSSTTGGCVPHVRSMESTIRLQAVEKHTSGSARGFGLGALGRQQALQDAATLYMKIGDIRKYCEIMIQLGKWDEALVVAPACGIEYWRELVTRHAKEQFEALSEVTIQKVEELLPLMVITGQEKRLVNLLLLNEQYDDACILSTHSSIAHNKTSINTNDTTDASDADVKKKKSDNVTMKGDSLAKKTSAEAKDNSLAAAIQQYDEVQIENIRYLQADKYMANGSCIEAACCHLSVNDIDGCLAKLIRGNEIELAFILIQAIGKDIRPPTESLLYMFANLASDVDVPAVAFKVAEGMERRLLERTVITVRHCIRLTEEEADKFHSTHGMRTAKSYAEEAAGFKVGNHDKVMEKLRLLLLGRQYHDALRCGLQYLKEVISKASWCKDEVEAVVRLLSLVDVNILNTKEDVTDKTLQEAKKETDGQMLITQVMFYSAYIASLNAMELGYRSIVRPLIEMAIDCSSKTMTGALANIANDVMTLERERYAAQYEPSMSFASIEKATKNTIMINNVETAVDKMPSSKAVGFGFDSLKKSLEQEVYSNVSSLARSQKGGCRIITRHGSIPSFSECKKAQSILGNMVMGTPCILEDGKAFMSIDDAIAWRRVCPYSPLLSGSHMPITSSL